MGEGKEGCAPIGQSASTGEHTLVQEEREREFSIRWIRTHTHETDDVDSQRDAISHLIFSSSSSFLIHSFALPSANLPVFQRWLPTRHFNTVSLSCPLDTGAFSMFFHALLYPGVHVEDDRIHSAGFTIWGYHTNRRGHSHTCIAFATIIKDRKGEENRGRERRRIDNGQKNHSH